MNTRKDIKEFTQSHGAMETWSAEDFDVFQNLLLASHRASYWQRAKAIALLACMTPLYVVESLRDAFGGPASYLSAWSRHLDRMDIALCTAEDACLAEGDLLFVQRLNRFAQRVEDVVLRSAARLAQH